MNYPFVLVGADFLIGIPGLRESPKKHSDIVFHRNFCYYSNGRPIRELLKQPSPIDSYNSITTTS